MRQVDAAGLAIGESAPPRIMGVVNVSPESPYDPSIFTDPGEAAAHIDELVDEGADIVDIGLASANKRLDVLSADEERDRLDRAATAIASASRDPVFSIETRYAAVADAAIDRGFEMVNDVCGFADPGMRDVCADHDVAVVKMASPPDLSAPGALDSLAEIHEGITRDGFTDKTIIDPAFGGWSTEKTLADDRETFRQLAGFRAYGRPILVSINRKNFLRKLVDRSTEDALPASLAATSMAVERGASVIRTHDVAPTRDAAMIGHELGTDRIASDGEVAVMAFDQAPAAVLATQLDIVDADTARAGDWSWSVFAIDGPDRPLEWLADCFAESGLHTTGRDPLVVAGPRRQFLRLHAHRDGADDAVAEALDTLVEAVQ